MFPYFLVCFLFIQVSAPEYRKIIGALGTHNKINFTAKIIVWSEGLFLSFWVTYLYIIYNQQPSRVDMCTCNNILTEDQQQVDGQNIEQQLLHYQLETIVTHYKCRIYMFLNIRFMGNIVSSHGPESAYMQLYPDRSESYLLRC